MRAVSFNQPIGNWNTAKVKSMSSMFALTSSFNQPLAAWNTSNVTKMDAMFGKATSFNQSLPQWDTSKVADMTYMLSGSAMSPASYGATLTGWASRPQVKRVHLDAAGVKYPASAAGAHLKLVVSSQWFITDGGQA